MVSGTMGGGGTLSKIAYRIDQNKTTWQGFKLGKKVVHEKAILENICHMLNKTK